MKPRLFWVLMLAFGAVIALGVAGMLTFALLTVRAFAPSSETRAPWVADGVYTPALIDYYRRNGGWHGVDLLFAAPPFSNANADFLVLPPNSPAAQHRGRGPDGTYGYVTPIIIDDQIVGGLLVTARDNSWTGGGPSAGARGFFRSFGLAGLVLAIGLVGLAFLFARWITRPLGAISAAAGTLAAGRLDVRAPPARIRELSDLAASFNGMAQSLGDADRQRRQLTADIAHELRTPLTIIRGRLEGIQDGVYQLDTQQVTALLRETTLLERLVDDLRLLTLAEAGQLTLQREPLDVAELLHEAQRAFAAQAHAQGIALVVDLTAPVPMLDADPQRLAQVLGNLLSNALRHTPAGGTITLRGALRDGQIELAVADTGGGIPADELPHIFDRFYRVDRARSRHAGGAGLGLAIVRQIAEAHGGSASATSTVGVGTTVVVRLPLHATRNGVPLVSVQPGSGIVTPEIVNRLRDELP